ncbi:MAG: hypothetical protein AAF602_23125, partial [Myxococcota bacterium]
VERGRADAARSAIAKGLELDVGRTIDRASTAIVELAAGAPWEATAERLVQAYAGMPDGYASDWEWEHLRATLELTQGQERLLKAIDLLTRPRDDTSVAAMRELLARP